jgi:hypothetical protein
MNSVAQKGSALDSYVGTEAPSGAAFLVWQASSAQNLLKTGEEYGMIEPSGGASMAEEEHLEILKGGIMNDNLAILTPEENA